MQPTNATKVLNAPSCCVKACTSATKALLVALATIAIIAGTLFVISSFYPDLATYLSMVGSVGYIAGAITIGAGVILSLLAFGLSSEKSVSQMPPVITTTTSGQAWVKVVSPFPLKMETPARPLQTPAHPANQTSYMALRFVSPLPTPALTGRKATVETPAPVTVLQHRDLLRVKRSDPLPPQLQFATPLKPPPSANPVHPASAPAKNNAVNQPVLPPKTAALPRTRPMMTAPATSKKTKPSPDTNAAEKVMQAYKESGVKQTLSKEVLEGLSKRGEFPVAWMSDKQILQYAIRPKHPIPVCFFDYAKQQQDLPKWMPKFIEKMSLKNRLADAKEYVQGLSASQIEALNLNDTDKGILGIQ